MANLEQIKNLNLKYKKDSAFTRSFKIVPLNESVDPKNIQLSFQNNINNLGLNFVQYFENGKDADVALLFIDICNFSTKNGHLNGKQISDFFDEYYDIVIPIIYEFGGEIDKIIGDGIICIFGQPFLNKSIEDCIIEADKCAKKILIETRKKERKINLKAK